MSAISGYINTIRNAVYGEQVRGAIVNALEACYSDVENPDLQSAAFLEAIEEAYDGGILDIVTVTQVSAMTNENIIYRYMGTQTGYTANTLYFHNGTAWVPIGSGVRTASTAAQMTDTSAIYKYTGNESGYKTNVLYYHNGSAWVPIAAPTDTTLLVADTAADSETVGNAVFSTVPNGDIFESGSLNPATGAALSSGSARRTKTYVDTSVSFVSCVASGVTVYVFVYNSSDNSYIGTWNGTTLAKENNGVASPCSIDLYPVFEVNSKYVAKVVYLKTGITSADDDSIIMRKRKEDPRMEDFFGAVSNLLMDAVYNTTGLTGLRDIIMSRYETYVMSIEVDSPVTLSPNMTYTNPTQAFGVSVLPEYATEKITYTSSNPSAVSIDGSSIVTGSSGTATITAATRFATATFTVSLDGSALLPLQDPENWNLNTGFFVKQKNGKVYTSNMGALNASAILKQSIDVSPNTTYTLSCASGYTIFGIALDSEDKYYGTLYGADANGNASSNSVTFRTEYNVVKLGINIYGSLTMDDGDITSAAVTLVEVSLGVRHV